MASSERWGALDNGALWIQSLDLQRPQSDFSHGFAAWSIADLFDLAARRELVQLWVHPSVTVDSDAGSWVIPDRDAGAWWQHGYLRGGSSHEVVQPALNNERDGGYWRGAWAELPDGEQLAAALGIFRQQLGILPHRGPSTTGSRLLYRLHRWKPSELLVQLGRPAPPEFAGAVEPELVWPLDGSRLTDAERRRRYVHSYDTRGQFLAACSSVTLGHSIPESIELPDELHQRLPGYWLIRAPGRGLPAQLPPALPEVRDAEQWVTTPTLQWAREVYGEQLEVLEGYYWPAHGRHLEPWYKRLRVARQAVMQGPDGAGVHPRYAPAVAAVSQAVKPVYTQTIGMLSAHLPDWDRSADPLWRPDWRDMVIATARCNLLRKLATWWQRDGMAPFQIAADCVYFASDEADPRAAAPPSLQFDDADPLRPAQLGKFAVKDAAVPMAEFLEHYDHEPVGRVQRWLNLRAGRR